MLKGFDKYWFKLKRRFYFLIVFSIIIPLISGILFLLAAANTFDLIIPLAFWIVYLLSIIALLLLWNSNIFWQDRQIVDLLHQLYPNLEYSLSVFFIKDLNKLQSIQQVKVMNELPSFQQVVFPINFKWRYIALLVSVLLYSFSFIDQMEKPVEGKSIPLVDYAEDSIDSITDSNPKEFKYHIQVFSPKYTGLGNFLWKSNKKIAEGSKLVFSNQGSLDFKLIWQNQYEFDISASESKSLTIDQSTIYQIEYKTKDSLVSLKPEVLEVIKDKPPVLTTDLQDNRYEIDWEDLSSGFEFALSIEDDYGILAADIIMTLSRGEGESVRFREMKQSLPSISSNVQKHQSLINIPLDTFSLKPGDELYFYFTANDNKQPNSNKGRTDVYFLSIADTAEIDPVDYEGFALTNEAEYFKSQRQIIIDTEKLIKEEKKISQDEFAQRSNTIGADQKLLRLRYGVFLGEEYETTGGLGEVDHSGHDHVDLEAEDDQHQEDHEGHEHESEGNFSNPIFNETPELEAYVHSHDESELSTFLDANVKVKLKEALANMWEAELFLRTYKPKEALPYEYKALKLIKEVKRASRIYVERMGFEPPPIDEEKKRLSGELDDIQARTIRDELNEKSFEKKLMDTYSVVKSAYSENDLNNAQEILKDFTNVLVSKITSEPVRYASLLAAIKRLQKTNSAAELQTVVIIMEDMIDPAELEKVNNDKSVRSTLHQTYYDLTND